MACIASQCQVVQAFTRSRTIDKFNCRRQLGGFILQGLTQGDHERNDREALADDSPADFSKFDQTLSWGYNFALIRQVSSVFVPSRQHYCRNSLLFVSAPTGVLAKD